jgi:hypothetical protein
MKRKPTIRNQETINRHLRENPDFAVAGIRRGLEQAKRGECRPMRAFLHEFAEKQGVSLNK